MKICFFGDYDSNYARNRVLLSGLRLNGVEILECNFHNESKIKKYYYLTIKYFKIKNRSDILLVGYSDDRWIVVLAWLLSWGKFLVWDAFYSLYDSWVFDRKYVLQKSWKAKYYWFQDWLACRIVNLIILDTNEHIKYFADEFKIKKNKFCRALIGSENFSSCKKKTENKFIVHFHGKFIPLQGTKYIIEAAKILEKNNDIIFRMVGKGQFYERDKAYAQILGLKNLFFMDFVPFNDIIDLVSEGDICLGIFGETQKNQRVIPNKVYEGIALGKPVVSADSPAIREIFQDRENILLCRAADPDDLAKKILELKNDNILREKIARGGLELYKNKATPQIIGKELIIELKKLR